MKLIVHGAVEPAVEPTIVLTTRTHKFRKSPEAIAARRRYLNRQRGLRQKAKRRRKNK